MRLRDRGAKDNLKVNLCCQRGGPGGLAGCGIFGISETRSTSDGNLNIYYIILFKSKL